VDAPRLPFGGVRSVSPVQRWSWPVDICAVVDPQYDDPWRFVVDLVDHPLLQADT
jgi:hypothetical protein